MNDEHEEGYLWDGSGDDEALRDLERLLQPVRPAPNLRMRVRRAWPIALAVALPVFFIAFFAISRTTVPTDFVGLFTSSQATRMSIEGGSRVEFSIDTYGGPELTNKTVNILLDRGAEYFAKGGIEEGHANIVYSEHSGSLRMDLPSVGESDARALASGLIVPGRLELSMVDNDSEFMKQVYARVKEAPENFVGVDVDIDQWRHDESGRSEKDYYLRASDAEALRQAFAILAKQGLVIPEGRRIVNERVLREARPQDAYWRSYLVTVEARVTSDDIESVNTMWSELMNRPEVVIDFTHEGGRAFGELTGENVGRKLAMVMDGVMLSAPTIQSRIDGGSTSITLGSADPEIQQRDATLMTNVLRTEPLKTGVVLDSVVAVPKTVSALAVTLGKGLMALLLALAIFLVSWLVIRKMGCAPHLIVGRPRAGRWRLLGGRGVVVLAGLFVVGLISYVLLPGVELDRNWMSETSFLQRRSYSFAALGIMPFISGAILSELIVLLIPSWRARRCLSRGGGRDPVHKLFLSLSLLMLAAQAHLLADWMTRKTAYGLAYEADALFPGMEYRWAFLAIIIGTVALYMVARTITERGFGNGFVWIFSLFFLIDVFSRLSGYRNLSATELCGTLAVVSVLALTTALVLRARFRLARGEHWGASAVGIAPVFIAPVASLLMLIGSSKEVDDFLFQSMAHEIGELETMKIAAALSVAALAAVWSLLFKLGRRAARVVGGTPSFDVGAVLVVVFSTGFVALVLGSELLLDELRMSGLMTAVMVVLGTAALMDLASEIRAHFLQPSLREVWRFHSVRRCDELVGQLVRADIEVYVSGRYLRSMLHVFGSYVPMVLRVPESCLEEATQMISSELTTEFGTIVGGETESIDTVPKEQ